MEVSTVNACRIQSLHLFHFRNYTALNLNVSALPVVLTGHNGAGKTNILEALSLLMPGRGIRRAKLSEITLRMHPHPGPSPNGGRGNEEGWVVAAVVETPSGEVQIGTGREAGSTEDADKRIVKIDGRLIKGHAELSHHVSMVWLTPQMDQLFLEGQSARRKFIDRLVYGFDPEHAGRVNAYEYAMRERNRLLSERRGDPFWLDSLEQKMAEASVAIAGARLETIARIGQAMQASTLSFPKASIILQGDAENALSEGSPAVVAEGAVMEALKTSRTADSLAGRSSVGAHRSEVTVLHVGRNMPAELCSTGEQKALLLSIILSEARAAAHWRGRVPVILLDEVVAHLDAGRRLELFEEICQIGAQTWMTGTDPLLFEGMQGKSQFFTVQNGSVFSEQNG